MPSAEKPERRTGSSPGEWLRATIEAFPGQPFAVVDGAHFDDVTDAFESQRLFARSLFLDSADEDVQKAGPWLVRLDQAPGALNKVMALVGDKPAAVYWCCVAGEMALWRHLRSINMVRIPTWAANGRDDQNDMEETYTSMIFRHYDPRVLDDLMPVLDAKQFRHVIGPADEIAFPADCSSGFRRILLDVNWPKSDLGQVIIGGRQIKELAERRISASHRRLSGYLREYAPLEVTGITDEQLDITTRQYDAQARAQNITRDSSTALWAYMQITCNLPLHKNEAVSAFLKSSANGADPDIRMETLFQMRNISILRRSSHA